jgi:hypothetical protein
LTHSICFWLLVLKINHKNLITGFLNYYVETKLQSLISFRIDIVIIFTIQYLKVKRKFILPLFLLIQIILLKIISYFPEFIEHYYSNGLYLYIAKFFRIVFGFFPFSIGDILYFSILLFFLFWLIKNRKTTWQNKILSALSFVSILYFFFQFLWGLNYLRLPLSDKLNLKTEYSKQDLYDFTDKLIVKTNAVQIEITKDKNRKIETKFSQDSIFKTAVNGFSELSKTYPYLKYENPSQKKSLFSLPLTYMGFGGYLNPFTNEAQVNYKVPMYGFPAIVSHEMSHQLGYGSESECNFIGFLACVNNDDLYFQYAAYSNALRYCLGIIALEDEKKFELYKEKINPGILKNYAQSEVFWQQYDSFIDKTFHAIYDQYLKANQQEEGIESYSKFIDLLINYYRNSNEL